MIAPARRAAYEVVRRVFEEEAYADRALGSAVERLDQRDRALAQHDLLNVLFGLAAATRDADYARRALAVGTAMEAAGILPTEDVAIVKELRRVLTP